MMQYAHMDLKGTTGLQFYKLLGTGKDGGFNPWPDWSTYALLAGWDHEVAALKFLHHSRLIRQYRHRSWEMCTIFLHVKGSKGFWDGQQPFTEAPLLNPTNPLIAVITRATIKWSKMSTFWRAVPPVQQDILKHPGLIFTKGIGEVPFRQMATFSLWESEHFLKQFAYRRKPHQTAIAQTRSHDWYSEELFARFQPYRTLGTWDGKLLLPGLSEDNDITAATNS